MAPMLAAETFPYFVLNDEALFPTYSSIARRSFRSSSNSPLSSAIRKTIVSTPAWVSFRDRRRPSRSGPISEMVARTGCHLDPDHALRRSGSGVYAAAVLGRLASSARRPSPITTKQYGRRPW